MPKYLEVSPETFSGMTPAKQGEFLIQIVIAFVLLAMISIAIKVGGPAAIVGGIVSLVGGYYFGNRGYNILVDPKSQKKMNLAYWNTFTCVAIPNDYLDDSGDFSLDLEVTKEDALIKGQYGGYAGVYLRSNLSPDSSGIFFDAFYVPPGQRVIKALPASGIVGGMTAADAWIRMTGDMPDPDDPNAPRVKGGLFTIKSGDDRPVIRNSANIVITPPQTGPYDVCTGVLAAAAGAGASPGRSP